MMQVPEASKMYIGANQIAAPVAHHVVPTWPDNGTATGRDTAAVTHDAIIHSGVSLSTSLLAWQSTTHTVAALPSLQSCGGCLLCTIQTFVV
jgi:hypothetical protein